MKSIKNIPAAKFKATCLALIDEVQQGNVEIVITKHGKPTAKLVPIESTLDEIRSRTSTLIKGDIISPLDKEDWGEFA